MFAMTQTEFVPIAQWQPSVSTYFEQAFGADGLQNLSQSLCRPPLSTSFRVSGNSSLEAALNALNTSTQSAQLGNWQTHPDVSDTVFLQGSGPHSVSYSDTDKKVIISRRAGEAVLRGAHVFVPGVLACSGNLCKDDVVAVFIVSEKPEQGSSTFLRGTILSHHAPGLSELCIGKGIVQFSRQEMFKASSGVGIEMTDRVFRLAPCHSLPGGLGMLQNLPSALVAHVLKPSPGALVLDMCASPGGKATHLAHLMSDQGTVVALDRTHAKAQQIRRHFAYRDCEVKACVSTDTETNSKKKRRPTGPSDVTPRDVAAVSSCKSYFTTYTSDCSTFALGPSACQIRNLSQLCTQHLSTLNSEPGTVASKLFDLYSDFSCGAQADLAAELGVFCVQAYKMDATTALLPTSTAPVDNMLNVDREPAETQQSNVKEQSRRERKARVRAMHGQAPIQKMDFSVQPQCKGFAAETFDYILLDAPCSALGLRPRLTHHTTMAELRQTAAYQRKLLKVAVKLLKPGGHLVFSTCTINPGENEANVAFALETFPLELVQQQPRLGRPGLTGGCLHEDGYREDWLTADQAALVQRFDPCSDLDTIGFFIAKFRKLAAE